MRTDLITQVREHGHYLTSGLHVAQQRHWPQEERHLEFLAHSATRIRHAIESQSGVARPRTSTAGTALSRGHRPLHATGSGTTEQQALPGGVLRKCGREDLHVPRASLLHLDIFVSCLPPCVPPPGRRMLFPPIHMRREIKAPQHQIPNKVIWS